MSAAGVPAASSTDVAETDRDALARYLLSFEWEFRNEEIHRILVDGGLPLWQQILEFVPQPATRGRALELGSPPFHITLLLQKFRNYDLSLTGFSVDGRPEITSELDSPAFGERYTFGCQCFDAERERFPYEDNCFDLVLWCEVIEHLTENPVHALSEIHRVLRPGGALVLSTPNAARVESIARLLNGGNLYDPYHLGAPLKGSRHSREYTLQELEDLIDGCGFEIERIQDINIYPPGNRAFALMRAVMNKVVARLTGGHYRYHLFVRARKTERPFRWYFPSGLFDEGHLLFHPTPRPRTVVMGWNDDFRESGWSDLRAGAGGKPMRRCGDVGDIYIGYSGMPPGVHVTLSDGKGQAQVWQGREGEITMLGSADFDAPADRWIHVDVPLSHAFDPGLELHLRIEAPGGVSVHRASTESG